MSIRIMPYTIKPFSLMPFKMPASSLLNKSGTPKSIVILPSRNSLSMRDTAMLFANTSSAPTDKDSIKTACIVYE